MEKCKGEGKRGGGGGGVLTAKEYGFVREGRKGQVSDKTGIEIYEMRIYDLK